MMDNLLLSEITKPKDIFLAITYPLEKRDFINDLSPTVNKEFVKLKKMQLPQNESPDLSWDLHIEQTANNIKGLCKFLRDRGGLVMTNFTMNDFAMISKKKIILLQAHFNKEEKTVELFDGKHSINDVVAAIPENFIGIFDLTVCNSDFLAFQIKKRFGNNCFVIQNKNATILQVRLPVWKTVIGILSVTNMNYIDADNTVRSNLIQKLKVNK
jgi:hypothetical protein